MSEPHLPETPELGEIDLSSSESWRPQYGALTGRAKVALALRCAKRVEPLRRLCDLLPDAFSAGLEVEPRRWLGGITASGVAGHAAWVAGVADDLESTVPPPPTALAWAVTGAEQAAAKTAGARTPDGAALAVVVRAAVAADIVKLGSLNLGRPGEPGEPIRWNDPRLGPLWPDGPPDWYVRAEQACRDLEDQLRNLPNPNEEPLHPIIIAQLEDHAWLDQLWSDGELDDYRGEFVIAAERTIFAHGRNLLKTRQRAEKKAQKQGIPPERLTDYFVPGLE
jgi:hypothetical protein